MLFTLFIHTSLVFWRKLTVISNSHVSFNKLDIMNSDFNLEISTVTQQFLLKFQILGAFFYFFSIQRVTSCWHQTCRITGGCRTTYHCGDHTSTSVNITLLTELCPISPSNATMFDFGIFGNGLQSGNLGLIDFSEKVFYFVWWGLRNLRFGL